MSSSKRSIRLAAKHVIQVPHSAIVTPAFEKFTNAVTALAGGYSEHQITGTYQMKAGASVREPMTVIEARVRMADYENDTRLERAFEDFARFLFVHGEEAVYRERGAEAWIEPR